MLGYTQAPCSVQAQSVSSSQAQVPASRPSLSFEERPAGWVFSLIRLPGTEQVTVEPSFFF